MDVVFLDSAESGEQWSEEIASTVERLHNDGKGGRTLEAIQDSFGTGRIELSVLTFGSGHCCHCRLLNEGENVSVLEEAETT